jgi:hypothetical protein
MNHFVDCLEGLSLTESRQLPRRSIVRFQDGRKIIEMTDAEARPEDPVSESPLQEFESEDLLP